MAILYDTLTTPDNATITGEILLVATTWRDNGTGDTLTRIGTRITLTETSNNTFTETIPAGEYVVSWKLRNTSGRPLEDSSSIYRSGGDHVIVLEDTDTPQRLRTLLGLGTISTTPATELRTIVEDWLTANPIGAEQIAEVVTEVGDVRYAQIPQGPTPPSSPSTGDLWLDTSA